jgi:hypothetical protein
VRRGLHADLTVFLCASDHKRASVLGWRMMAQEWIDERRSAVETGSGVDVRVKYVTLLWTPEH